jgi:alpha-beta hydrolase superfamily lysophospholipase
MKFLKKFIHPLLYFIAAVIFIIVVRALDSRLLPDLRPWHRTSIGKEVLFSKEYKDIDSYLKDEDAYIRELYSQVADSAKGKFNRFNPESKAFPLFENDNLNASFVVDPGVNNTKGVILLLHGLSDSPYHMRALAQVFKNEGFYVFALRLPGHGTLPSGLLDVTWQQWAKATSWGADRLAEIAKQRGDVPFYMGGFSTGGALVLNYSLKALNDAKLHQAKKLFLFSPAIGVSKLAKISSWHKTLSWLDYFEKFRWLDVLPEYDPAKYNSFTKNAGRQIYLLTLENKELMDQVAKANKQYQLPAMIAFQSLVDATVIPRDLFDMYQEIGTSKDELFVYDINRMYADLMKKEVLHIDPRNIEFTQEDAPKLHILINNLKFDSIHGPIACGVYEKLKNDSLVDVYPNHHSAWPIEFFAMSHVAVPIAPDNRAYGQFSTLGQLTVKGERDVLLIYSDDLLRIRYNPFFDLMSREISDFIKRN